MPHLPSSTTTITLPYQSPEFRASLLFQEWERGREREGEEDKTEAVGVDPRLSSLLSLFGVRVYVQGRQSVYAGVPAQVYVC